ncbi:MAG: AraC family transcriptional regulator [Clostridiales bacterium]|nr:AraC family transcriptional regulator [Clostridiales bacterium]
MVKREGFQTVIHDSTPDGEQFNQEILLLFVLEGSLKVSVENKISDLDMEDILVINANKRYSLRSGKNVLYMTLSIDYASVVDTMEDGDVIFLCNSSMKGNEEAYAQLRTRIRHMLNHFVEAGEPGRSFAYFSDCYGILNDLAANFRIKVNDLGSLETSDRYEDRIRQIDNYIHANYDQPISMREMSEKMFLSNGYLSRFFKKNYGMSFASYLTNVRLYHAVDDLIHSDAPITRVAYNNGFTSAALFNKVFRKAYGLSPSEFRKNSEGQAGEEAGEKHKKELENRLGKALAILPAEEDTRLHTRVCETVFSAKSYEPLKPYWGEIINFGDASHLLNSTIREHLYMLKQAFGFKYVRFSNIFSHMTLIDLEKRKITTSGRWIPSWIIFWIRGCFPLLNWG